MRHPLPALSLALSSMMPIAVRAAELVSVDTQLAASAFVPEVQS